MATRNKRAKSAKTERPETSTEPKVMPQELGTALTHLADLIAQKKPILEALETCVQQQSNMVVAEALMGVRLAVRNGAGIADAMGRYPAVFPAALVKTVRAGESSDEVAAGLRRWATGGDPELEDVAAGEVKREEVEAFKRDFADRIVQGSTLVEALALSSYTSGNSRFAQVLKEVQEAITNGRGDVTPSAAMARYPNVFDKEYLNLWREIEAGKIEAVEALSRHASQTNQELLTLDQAVQFLGTSKPTLYRLLAQGELNGLKVGRQWRFRKADLIAHMERKPAPVAASAAAEIDAELEFLQAEAEKVGARLGKVEEDNTPDGQGKITQLLYTIISIAIKSGASDIHIEPMAKAFRVRTRREGVLSELRSLPSALLLPLVGRVKVMADLDVMERRLPQDGRIHIHYDGQDFDLRVTVCPTQYGESVVMRILMAQSPLIPLDNLDLAPDHREQLETLLHRPNGLIAFTGPAGSGKTTVLYSCLNLRGNDEIKIITLEDPVEWNLPFATQIHINAKAGLTYPIALRSVFRQDPDIIMIGEINDVEVAGLSVNAAFTGHLVLTQMFTEEATSFLTRLIELGVEPFLISTSVIGVLSQRLPRKICTNCKEEYTPSPELLLRLGHDPRLHPEVKFYRGRGCDKCRQSGFKGRTAIYELLRMNDELAGLIMRRASHEELKAAARANGMRTMAEDGFLKCKQGLTTPEEVMRAVFSQT